jgi:very-short-patch-repair endonuclease
MTDEREMDGPSRPSIFTALDTLRRRLLDLTNNNRLLNYRHSSKSCLQIVDELPDELFQRLMDGDKLTFIPVPDPDPEKYLPDESELNANTIEPIEPSITEGQTRRRRKPTAKEYARIRGISTSYELPKPSTNGPEFDHHKDDRIQTLHYAEDLERLLRRVDSAARTTIEESGVNMLYLAFGFLEWSESDTSEEERLAPLIMVPVNLERKANKASRRFECLVEYSNEDVAFNDSLQEKLKQEWSIDLPRWDEDDTPESYFDKLAPILRLKPKWRLRRQITLTLLQFGKILMYRDLNPSNWPNDSLITHDRIRDVFQGTDHSSLDKLPEYEIDAPEFEKRVPFLISNADSSQHSALIDALDGKNLVIEGPPGTGKSQTITNLIAVLLAAGKSVLFISDKLAALEVVRRRLDDAGLGMFCLELHSAKTQKKKLLEDLKQRIDARQDFPDAKVLDTKLQMLNEHKQNLLRYRQVLLSPFGAMGFTVFDILWRRERLKGQIGEEITNKLEAVTVFENIEEIKEAELQRAIQLLTSYQSHHVEALGLARTGSQHPWYGLRNIDLSYFDEKKLLDALSKANALADRIMAALREFQDRTLCGLLDTVKGVIELAATSDCLPLPPSTICHELLETLSQETEQARLKEYCEKTTNCLALQSRLLQSFEAIPIQEPAIVKARLETLLGRHAALGIQADDVAALRKFADRSKNVLAALESGEQTFRYISDLLGWQAPYSGKTLELLVKALPCVESAPVDALPFRRPTFMQDSALVYIEKAMRQAQPLREQFETWQKVVIWKDIPSVSDLNRFAGILESTGVAASLFNSEYRAAKKAFYRISRSQQKRSGAEMADAFHDLALFKEKLDAFLEDNTYKALLGEYFQGLETAFEMFYRLVAWCHSIRVALAPLRDNADSLCECFLTQLTAQLISLNQWNQSNGDRIAELKTLHENLDTIARLFPSDLLKIAQTDFSHFKFLLQDLVSKINLVLTDISQLRLHDDVPLGRVDQLAKDFIRYDEARLQVASDRIAGIGSTSSFEPTVSRLRSLTDTLAFCQAIKDLNLPIALHKFLHSVDVVERIAGTKSVTRDIATVCNDFVSIHNDCVGLGAIELTDWYKTKSQDVREINFSCIAERLSAALLARNGLTVYLELLRLEQQCQKAGLTQLASLVDTAVVSRENLEQAVCYMAFHAMTDALYRRYPLLNRLGYQSLETVRQQFMELDREAMKLSRARAAHGINKRPVPRGIRSGSVRTYTDMALIDNELLKQRNHVPIRQLVNRAGPALQALKPCFMMGPLSVAQYFEPGRLQFDVLIMDEASQLKPEEAVGAIARAGQVIIVGDQKQLPPTSFFEQLIDDEPEDPGKDYSSIVEAESILEQASRVFPSRDLRWHYRSRHGSLIAYSNRQFYDKRLIVFPSATIESPTLGLKFMSVPDGLYEHSKNRTEAETVVAAACNHMRTHPGETLGIVALNVMQRDLIEELFDEAMKQDVEAQQYVQDKRASLEPFFIKNLENVQGDERDVIFISCTYGKDSLGHLYQRFGPINGKNGHRRLNVLFTRAKRRVVVFSSLDPAELIVDEKSSRGLRAFQGYLEYAKTKILDQPTGSAGPADSDFEIAVGTAIKHLGYEISTQVGVAGYFIDLAVCHPKKSGTYMLGVECDGATFHSGKSARDRDRLRQEILEDLGWQIHRIWSTDWFKHKDREIMKLKTVMERCATAMV